MARLVALALIAGCSLTVLLSQVSADSEPRVMDPANAVEHCRKLVDKDFGIGKSRDFIEQLGKTRQFACLKAIYEADISAPAAMAAAEATCHYLDTPDAIMFCTQFELDSDIGSAALTGLCHHPKQKVIGYIKQLASSSNPRVRGTCYWLCQTAKWDDLVDTAKSDLNSRAYCGPSLNMNFILGPRLGTIAEEYIREMENLKYQEKIKVKKKWNNR